MMIQVLYLTLKNTDAKSNTFVSFPFLHSLPHYEAGSQSQHDIFLLVQQPFFTTMIGDHLGTHSDYTTPNK